MHVKTILNRIEKQPGFIYESCKWRDSGSPALVITLRPQVGSKPVCSRWREATRLRHSAGQEFRVRPSVGNPGFLPLRSKADMLPNLRNQGRKNAMGQGEKPPHHNLCLVPGYLGQAVELERSGGSIQNQLGRRLPLGENGGRVGARTS